MNRRAIFARLSAALVVALIVAGNINAQSLDWRRVANTAIDLSLPGLAAGPVDRVWFSPDGSTVFCRTALGQTFSTSDSENWRRVFVATPPSEENTGDTPEDGARIRLAANRAYAFGRDAWRSEDGRNWSNLTSYRGQSILGGRLLDMAVSPRDPDEVVVAGNTGVWRSVDGGLSWHSLNDTLPNLPVRRIVSLPRESGGLRIALNDRDSVLLEWSQGEKRSWKPVPSGVDAELRAVLSSVLETTILAAASSGRFIYAGSADSRIWISDDAGQTWREPYSAGGGAVLALWVDASEPRSAFAALDRVPAAPGSPKVLRTINAGVVWDNLTSDLPDVGVQGITADRSSGAIYLATELGVFSTTGNVAAAGPATAWTPLSGLPSAAVRDVRLDVDGHELYAAVSGYGIYATPAPHRRRELRVVNSADFSDRPAAPGSLVSVLGGRVVQATAGALQFPILDSSESESQLQVPFEAEGSSVSLMVQAGQRRSTLGLALAAVSPAIFVDRDGSPMILDGETGVLLDARIPARPGSRLQILATGLGRVRPEWPSGLAAPLDDPPAVVAPVRVMLDGVPVEVLRATLAPGYVGFYVIEVRLPDIANAGYAALVVEAGGRRSNQVHVQLEQ